MFQFLINGGLDDCPAPKSACTCESKLYATTGTLALIAGLIQWVVGYHYSMAELSDSVHAFSDGFADFVLMAIVLKTLPMASTHDVKALRTWGNKVNAILLVVGAFVVLMETYGRINQEYLVWLPAVAVSTSIGLVIDLIRMRMLSKAKKHYHSENIDGAISHAMSDAVHSTWATTVAVVGIIGGTFFSEDSYSPFLRIMDQGASYVLAAWMMFILAPRIWKGKGCCGVKKHSAVHQHDSGCNH